MNITFSLPPDYRWYLRRQGGNVPPWRLTDEELRESCVKSIQMQYPWYTNYYPFAFANEDVAIFAEKDGEVIVQVIHMGMSKGNEVDVEFASFIEWYVSATRNAADLMRDI